VDEAGVLRFQSLRRKTKGLLEGGEQPHVEFKRTVPSSIANQAAAGANFVALNPSVDVHTILLGVEEETLPNGTTRGRAVGCLEPGGRVQDLDQLRLQVEQKIRDAVVPPPQVTIFEEKVASMTPILVVEIRPTDPPHRVADRYQVRGAAGIQALTQHDAQLLFRNKRTQAWIDELESSNPLLAVLQTLQRNYEDLAYRVSDAALAFEGESVDDLERLLSDVDRSIDAVHERLSTLQSDVDTVRSELDTLSDPIASIEGRTDELVTLSPERIWHELRDRREMRWLRVNHHAALGDYADEDLALIELMVREHFGAEPDVSDYAANLAELQGFALDFSADEEKRSHLEVVAGFVSAAIARAQGVPGRFSADWIAEGIASRRDLDSMVENVAQGRRRRRAPAKPIEREIGILDISTEGAQALADHRRATTASDSAAIIWRTDQGAIMAARSVDGRTVPLMYRPTWGSDLARRGKPRTRQLGTEFRNTVEAFAGRLTRIEGPGLILGGRAARTVRRTVTKSGGS
jgi:hypothetical protein